MIRHIRTCDVCTATIEAFEPNTVVDRAREAGAVTCLAIHELEFTGPRDLCGDCQAAIADALRRLVNERKPRKNGKEPHA